MPDGQQTQTFDPDTFHQDYIQKSGGGPSFDPDAFHAKFTGNETGTAPAAGGDRQTSIKQKYGLPASVDLSKGIGDPANIGVKDPLAFSRAYQEFNPPAAKPHGFLANAWDEAKNLVRGATSEPSPFGATDVPLLEQPAREFVEPPIETAKSIARGDAKGAAKNAVRSVPIVGPMAVARGEQFRHDPWGAVGAGVTDALALTVPRWAPELGEGADILSDSADAGREGLAERIARPTVSKPWKAAKADIVHGHAPERAIVGEKISNVADADARMSQIGQAIDNTLTKPQHAGKTVDVQPIIDAAYQKAVTSAKRSGELGAISRLDSVREAFETEHGQLGKSPRAAAQMFRDIRKMGVKYGPDPERNIVAQFRKDVADGISTEVKRQVPEARSLMSRYGDAASAREAMEPREIARRQKGILSAAKEGLEDFATRKTAQIIGKQYPASDLDVLAQRPASAVVPARASVRGSGAAQGSIAGEIPEWRRSGGVMWEDRPTLEEPGGPLARTEAQPANSALMAVPDEEEGIVGSGPYRGPSRPGGIVPGAGRALPGMVARPVRGLLAEQNVNELEPGRIPITPGARRALPPGVAVGTAEPPSPGSVRTIGGNIIGRGGQIEERLPEEAYRERTGPLEHAQPKIEDRTKSEAEVRLERRIEQLDERLKLAKTDNKIKALTREKRGLQSQLEDARARGRKYSVEASYAPDVAQGAKEEMQNALRLWEELPEPSRTPQYDYDETGHEMGHPTGWVGTNSPKETVYGAFPWLRNMREYNLSDLREALRRGKGQVYDRFIEAAAEYVKAQKETGAERPLGREPGEDEEPPF